MTSYRLPQGLTGALALIPILTGAITMKGVHDPLYAALDLPGNPLLDSNLRFLGGVWLGLGLAAFWMVPRLRAQTVLFRVVWPPAPLIAFTVLESVGAPLFVAWHARVVNPLPR